MSDLQTTLNIADRKRQILVGVAKDFRKKYQDELEKKKEDKKNSLESLDFLWRELLTSYSTWGSSRGFDGMIERYNQVSYDELKKLDPEERINRLLKTMNDANVRWSNKKAPLLNKCFEKIEKMGGLAMTGKKLREMDNASEIIEFLDDFPGIGQKYARDIMMDSYHPLFRDKIALDSRVKSVSTELGLIFENYTDHENFYLNIAREAGIEGWELDRLIYGHTDDFLAAIRQQY